VNKLLIRCLDTEWLADILLDDELWEHRTVSATASHRVHDVVLAKVAKQLPSLNACMAEIGEGKQAFVKFEGEMQLPKSGTQIAVELTAAPSGIKGWEAKASYSLPGQALVLTPLHPGVGVSGKITDTALRKKLKAFGEKLAGANASAGTPDTKKMEADGLIGKTPDSESYGWIIRTQASSMTEEELTAEAHSLLETHRKMTESMKYSAVGTVLYRQESPFDELLRGMDVTALDEVIFDTERSQKLFNEWRGETLTPASRVGGQAIADVYRVSSSLEAASRKQVYVGDGYLFIEKTETLWTIDVNSGKPEGKALKEGILTINESFVHEIARQIVLRNMTGMILIDFIRMKEAAERESIRRRVQDELEGYGHISHINGCQAHSCRIYGFGPMGLLEMTRSKT